MFEGIESVLSLSRVRVSINIQFWFFGFASSQNSSEQNLLGKVV
jgi:hypothetical protein